MFNKGTRSYAYCIIHEDGYDTDEAFLSSANAVYAAVELGERVAVLDALSLEYLGEI